MNADLTGRQILHFRILERIGGGGMGAVFKAEDAQLGRIVALKFFPFYLTPRPEEVARFEREAKAAASADHPNLCTVYGFYSTPDFQFIAMEYVPGVTLKRKLERQGPMSCDKALDILGRAAEALAAAHRQGVIHRDVKSDNIMLTPDGGVKVMDFGLATFRDAPSVTKTGEILGTVAYMSPEQAEGKPMDCRTDLWSLGVVLYEMLTGVLPFQGDSDVAVLQNILHARPLPVAEDKIRVWKSIRYILNTLLEKNVRYRYPNADRLIEDIHRKARNSGLMLACGRLGDIRGFRRVFIAGFAVFTAGSLLCGLATSIGLLIAFRVVQGIGAAAIEAIAPAMITVCLPAEKRGWALEILMTILSVAIAAGPILGGFITEYLSWHWVFFINVPIGIVAVALAIRYLPQDVVPASGGRFDTAGAVLILLALGTLLFPLNQGLYLGWTSPVVIGSSVASLLFFTLF